MADNAAVPAADAPTSAAPGIQQKLAAEVLGTFALVFFGCGAVVYSSQVNQFTIATVGLTFGVVVMVMAYAFGRVSGATSTGGLGGRRGRRPGRLARGPAPTSRRSSSAPCSAPSRSSCSCTASTATAPRATWARTSSATRAAATPGGRRSSSRCSSPPPS